MNNTYINLRYHKVLYIIIILKPSKCIYILVSECKTKWTTLRNSFSRQLREQKKIPSGSGASKKRKQYLYDNMTFLTDYMMQHKSMVSNLIEDDLNETLDLNLGESEILNTVEEPYDVSSELTPTSIMCEETIQSSNSSQIFKKPKKIKKVMASEMVAEPMINYLKSKTIQKVEDSPELLFLKSVIPDFKKLNDKNQRRFKNTILSSLDKLLDEQEPRLRHQLFTQITLCHRIHTKYRSNNIHFISLNHL